ncbi:MAG: hypothetical protein HPY76_06915, partial [Anaerolineae bacterium]|nr:hypothetical protein [Anaerolineae bacterium]
MKSPILFRFAIPCLLIFAAACTPAVPQDPTTDPLLLAFAVQTAHADLTAEALANPSATPTPTDTPVPPPTNTPEPTFTLAPVYTATPAGSSTPTQAQGAAVEFVYAATYPENKRVFLPNETFGLALGFQNVGTVPLSGCLIKLVNFSGEDTVDDQASSDK